MKRLAIFQTGNGSMRIKRVAIPVLLLLSAASVKGQSRINKHVNWWPAYYLKYAINNKWDINSDIQIRNQAKRPLVGLISFRSGVYYHLNEHWTVAAGLAWFNQQQYTVLKEKRVTNEIRLWEAIRHDIQINRWSLQNQLRVEQRHWINPDENGLRLGYKLAGKYRFNEKWSGMAGSELMWQSRGVRKDWDQNQTYLGGELIFNENNAVQLLLMSRLQISSHTYQPVVRINFIQSII